MVRRRDLQRRRRAQRQPGGRDQVPEDRLALDDPRVLRGEHGRGRLIRERREVRSAADLLQVPVPLERLGDRDDVDRLTALPELEHGGVDAPVRLPVEVLGPDDVGDLDDRVAVDQERAKDGLLGFDALGRKAVEGHADSDGMRGGNQSIVAESRFRRQRDVHELAAISPTRPGCLARSVESLWTNRLSRGGGSPR